ncbi:MAG: class II aldolase/adducin family protein [Clostridium sp.]|jgi:L-fuculose-phosphate aldolase
MSGYLSDKEAKLAILDIGRRLYQNGFVASNDGNITCRVSDREVWATPTGVSKGFMTEEMLVKLDLDGNILEGTAAPSSEIKMHLRVYKENSKVQGVVHAHPLTATSFACAGMSLEDPVLVEGVLALGCVPLAHFALPGTQEVPDSVAPYCRAYNAVLLANHGALTWGTSLTQAYYRMESVEYYAKVLLMTKFVIGKSCDLSASQVKDIIAIRTGMGVTGGGMPPCTEDIKNDVDIVRSSVAEG